MKKNLSKKKIAVLIPCFNEEKTVRKVVTDFKNELEDAVIYVYDNNSSDNTAKIAKEAGAIVIKEHNQGKGNVIRSMFRDIDADVYLMTDGDDTYPAKDAKKLIEPVINEDIDMVIGDRLTSTYFTENKRMFHNSGNVLVRWLINNIFKSDIQDVMTGYRAFSRKFVKTITVMSPGFQVETELTAIALQYRYNLKSIPVDYKDRPEGSVSKLNTFKDGLKVLITLFDLAKNYKPLKLFSSLSLVSFILGLVVGIPVIVEFCATKYITKIPSAVLASALMIISFLLISLGIILDHQSNIDKRQHEYEVNKWVANND